MTTPTARARGRRDASDRRGRASNSEPAGERAGPLLDALTDGRATAASDLSRLERFLAESSSLRALALWLGDELDEHEAWSDVARRLGRDIAAIDALLNEQLNVILHHHDFQRLESSWRGLRYLVDQADPDALLHIRVLDLSWRELVRDLERAPEFDQSQLWRKVYDEEFGMPGGRPFGILLGDYEIYPRPGRDHPTDDIAALESIAQVAAGAFAPFVTGAHPELFGIERFAEMERGFDVSALFDRPEYLRWRSLRQRDDARFLGLTLPRVLMRQPWEPASMRSDHFCFREDIGPPDGRNLLWGTAVWAFGTVVMRAFAESGWLADIRGVRPGEIGAGLVVDLPESDWSTDPEGAVLRPVTDLVVTDIQEREMTTLGFISLCRVKDTPLAAFYGTPSVHQPPRYDDKVAMANARIASLLQYVLCASRFAHYLKVIVRDHIGLLIEAREMEDRLQRWVTDYVTPDARASPAVKARYPLREAQVQVREQPGRPGHYYSVFHLWPHFQLDDLSASVRLRTEMGVAGQH